ncbi:hypothetical protein [Streptomyces clavuligerus]|uniref:DUF7848 domain-containing protein n=1 Tax=Streptomyces clavuligerus TaxID=1901 RepID=UPI000B1E9301
MLVPTDGAPTTRMIQCTECEERSPLGPPLAAFARWALGHADVTGHREFQQVTTELLHAVLPVVADPSAPTAAP